MLVPAGRSLGQFGLLASRNRGRRAGGGSDGQQDEMKSFGGCAITDDVDASGTQTQLISDIPVFPSDR
jgi:hypothetical protein